MKTKTLILGIVICLSAVLGGCSSGGDSDHLTLALRAGTYSEVIKQCLPDFEAQYGVTCEVLELGEEELHNAIMNDSVNSRGEYDLCMVDGSWMAEFMSEGVLSCLSDMSYEFDDDIIPATTSICISDGKIYLVPYYGNVTVALYNKSALEAAGLDKTGLTSLADMMKLCEMQQAQGKKGFIYRGDTENNIVVDFLPILCAYGGWVVDDNNKPTVTTPEFKKAMSFYMQITATGTALSKTDMIAAIDKGEGAIGIGWPGWYTPDSTTAAYYCAVPGKRDAESKKYNSNIYGIWTIGIPDNSRNKDTAMTFLEYLMDPEVQMGTVANGGVPCRYSCLQDSATLAKYPYYKEVCDALENGVYRPVIREWPQFYTILGNEMKNIIDGKISLEEGLKVAQNELEILMGSSEK